MQNDLHKRCSKCGEVKARDAYSLNKRNGDGVQSCCKECMRQYRLANAEHHRQYNREYYAAHAETILEQKHAYQQKNREQINAKRRLKRKAQYQESKDQYQESKTQRKNQYQESKRRRFAAYMPATKEEGS